MEEEALPELTLRILCELGLGRDPETAAEISLNSIRNEFLSRAFSSASTGSAGKILRLRNILSHCARTGAPAREELLGFLQDLQAENETRWEERTQRLPVVLLAPLFLCFFPSALLLLGGLLIPLLWNTI